MIVDIYFDFFFGCTVYVRKRKNTKKAVEYLIGQYGSLSIETIESNKYIIILEADT